jgi:predicted alpha-1,2-mannosidase
MAEKMGQKAVADEFFKRSKNYENVFNPSTGFMQPRDDNGEWQSGFSPDEYTPHISESNAWQYFWSVQHDIPALIRLIGGEDRFLSRLDSMFTYTGKPGHELPIFSTGMIGQYAHGNEPGHHVIYLYNYTNQPWKTAHYARQVMDDFYKNSPDGLCGNEDLGQMSAWYVFSAMGLYPVNPVSGKYEIGAPLFRSLAFDMENGKRFKIVAPGVSKKAKFVKSVKLNGNTLKRSYITHDEIMQGGVLEFEMTSEDGINWLNVAN